MHRERLHVMHLVLSLETGGCENGIVNLINNMDADRFKVSACCLDSLGAFCDRIRPERRNLHLVARKGRPGLKEVSALASLFRRERVDLLHTHGWGTLAVGYLSAKMAGIPAVVHGEHGGLYLDSTLRILAQKLLLRMVDRTVTVSRDLQARLSSRFQVDNVAAIINGVDAVRFVADRDRRALVRKQHGIPENGCVIGSVGRLVGWKRFDLLIEAAAGLIRDGRELYVIIVGDGPMRGPLQALIEECSLDDRILLVGRTENVVDFLSAMDIFTVTSSSRSKEDAAPGGSEFEGISNALLEAMSCGLPVVASRTGGTPEVVVDGCTGYLYQPDEVDSFAVCLANLVSDPALRARMGRAARRAVEEEFTLGGMVRGYENLYLQLAAEKSIA